jgi:toluene monooxygenase system protein E
VAGERGVTRRTYWHLEGRQKKPTAYEIASSRLLYYPERGFEVAVPLADWYARYQAGSPLRLRDWDAFADPRQTTYARYTELQLAKETYVSGLLDAIDATGYDARLAPAWIALLDRVLAPMRYPLHGLQMIAAYVGHMAPGGRIVIAAAFQAADEMRRVQRIAYRMRQLQLTHPDFGRDSRRTWQEDPLWQPLRALIERLLVTYDWGEALVALDLVVKPAVDRLLMDDLGQLAARRGDDVLQKIFLSLAEDCAWHVDWSRALCDLAAAEAPANAEAIAGWVAAWQPPVERAVAALRGGLDELAEAAR